MERKHNLHHLWKWKSSRNLRSASPGDQTPARSIRRPKSSNVLSRFRWSRSEVQPEEAKFGELRDGTSRSRRSTMVAFQQPVQYPPIPPAPSQVQERRPGRTLKTSRKPFLFANEELDVMDLEEWKKHMSLGGDDRLMTDPSRARFNEDIADRNLGIRHANIDGTKTTTGRSMDILDHGLVGYPRVLVEKHRYSEDVADRNMNFAASTSDLPSMLGRESPASSFRQRPDSSRQTSASLLQQLVGEVIRVQKYGPSTARRRSRQCYPSTRSEHTVTEHAAAHSVESRSTASPALVFIAPEAEAATNDDLASSPASAYFDPLDLAIPDTRHFSRPLHRSRSVERLTIDTEMRQPSTISSLDFTTDDEPSTPDSYQQILINQSPTWQSGRMIDGVDIPRRRKPAQHEHIDEVTEAQLQLAGIDLNDTEDTDVHYSVAPEVVHETIRPTVHEFCEEHITREIHYHDYYHRILPITDVEVLPAKHFVRTPSGTLNEIRAEDVPGLQHGADSVGAYADTDEDAHANRAVEAETHNVSHTAALPIRTREYCAACDDATGLYDENDTEHEGFVTAIMGDEGGEEKYGEQAVNYSHPAWVEPPARSSADEAFAEHEGEQGQQTPKMLPSRPGTTSTEADDTRYELERRSSTPLPQRLAEQMPGAWME